MRQAAQLALIPAASALLVGLIGWLAVRRLRRRSITAAMTVAVLTAVCEVAAGVLVTGALMLTSRTDLASLLLAVGVAAVVGTVSAAMLGRSVVRDSRRLGDVARSIGDQVAAPPYNGPAPVTAELGELHRQLETTRLQLAESRRREQALEGSRRELVAWVSHDLRTPLAGLRAMSEALEDGVANDAETIDRYHRQMRVETDRLAAMVDDLFELSRLHTGSLRMSLTRVTLGDLVSDAVASTDPLARGRGVRLVGGPGSSTGGLTVDVSVPDLGRALRNLITNAIRYTPSDGAITVATAVEDECGIVTVADACGGIPEADLPRLFEVAFRGTPARTPELGGDGGAGLGLAIARGIVEAHAGSIDVANAGDGCRFRIRLPLASSTVEPQVDPPVDLSRPPARTPAAAR